jgi:hypothetical protein
MQSRVKVLPATRKDHDQQSRLFDWLAFKVRLAPSGL